ncbi:MAG: DedA family protein [Candidatus Aquicultorales bacterium]
MLTGTISKARYAKGGCQTDVIRRFSPYVARWGYFAIFIATFMENMGVPIPGEILILIAASFALHGRIFLPLVIMVAAAGAVAGDSVIFFIGRFGGRRAIAKLRDWFSIDRSTIEKVDAFYHRNGPYAVVFGRFVTGGRFTIAITSGASETMSWEKYALFDYIGALIWAGAFGIIGYYFADQIGGILALLARSSLWLGVILLAGTIIYLIVSYFIRRSRPEGK